MKRWTGISLKTFMLLSALILVTTMVRAATNRVDELRKEAQELMDRRTQYQGALNNVELRLIEIQGALKEAPAILAANSGDKTSAGDTHGRGKGTDTTAK